MNELKAVLAAFLAGQAEFAEVDAVLARSLNADPAIAPSAFAAIDQIYKSGRLPLQLYVQLKKRIAQSHAAARAPVPPSAPAPSPEASSPSAAPDRTMFNPGTAGPPQPQPQLPVPPPAQPRPPPQAAAPPPVPPRAPEPPPQASEPEAPPSDRTIMRGRPPPRAPGVSQPHSPSQRSSEADSSVGGPLTGAEGPVTGPASRGGPFDLGNQAGPSETSHTGAVNTGRTSNTGTGTTGTGKTGTGSSSWTDPAKWEERPQVALERGSVLKGRFVLENVVGRGGMGVVFRAKDLRKEEAQDRDPYVAVKILNDEFRRHPESLKALQREARKSQQLAHPNIVSVFDFDRDGGTVYMTMEFLEGEALDRVIKNPQFEGMALSEAYPLIRGLGSALSYAHDKGIVHSDFKPGNCFLTQSGVIKVFDFGIAQAAKIKGADLHGEETKFDAGSLGALTPAYASCEMIAGEQPDTRDDIYAFGCVVYELLTGKHPFSKKSAADARDQKLVPTPIKRLTRRQWRAIEKSLAFRRADRTASVWDLIDGLAKQQLFSAPRIAVGAAAVVVLGVGAYFGVNAWQQAQRGRLVAALTSRDDARVTPALQRLGQLEAVERITVVQEVSAPLLDWYIARIDASVDEKRQRYDFPGAAALVAEAKVWFPDSARLTTRETMLDSRKNELLQELDQKFTANLQAGRLLEDPQGEDIVDVLGIVSQVEPGHKLLSDPRLSFEYVAQASDALKRADTVRARPLIDAGLARYPANAQLTDLRDNLTAMLGEQEKAQRFAALQTELGRAAGLRTLAELRGLESSVRELATLAPDDPALRAYRGRVATALDAELQGPLGERDWDGAQQRIADVGALLAPEQQRDAQGRVAAARTDYEGKRDAIFARLNRTVADGRLNDAPAVLRDLDALRADAATKAQARGIVVQGYASDAQRLAGAGQLPQAITRVQAGLAFESASPELTALLETLSTQDQVAKEQGATEAKRRRDEEAAGLRNSINAALTQPTLTLAAAKDTLAQMSRLAALADADPLATNGREQVAQKLAKQATDAGNAGQGWDQVVAQLDQALGLVAGSPTLQSARAGAQANVERAREGERVARGAQLQQALDALLAAPRYDAAWVKDVRDQLASMNGLVPEAEIAQRQQRAAEILIARGAERRGQERFAEANAVLGLAATLAPRLDTLVAEQAQLKDAMDASARATGAARQAADIEALKSSFMTSVNANSTKEANDKLTELRAKLPATDPFLTTTAPQALADVSLRLARARVAEQDYDRAEQLIVQGLALWPKSESLQALSADVRAARDQRLTKNVSDLRAQLDRGAGDSNDGKRVLTQIRSDAGTGFGAIERELTARAETHIGANAADDAYRAYAGMIFGREFARPAGAAPLSAPPAPATASTGGAPAVTPAVTTPPPRAPVGGRPCTTSMAAQGRRAQAVCYDTFGASIKGPEFVVAPPGGGSAAAFAIGRTELKVANWNDYCKASGKCPERPNPTNPVTNVSAAEAQDYAAWLTQQTGFTYRLPTRDEWVYVASAPRQNPKNFNCINPTNGKGGKLLEIGESGNDWGVIDYLGNVQEWVKTGAGFEARGGHYDMQLAQCTADRADARTAGAGDEHTGVRLVREIPGGLTMGTAAADRLRALVHEYYHGLVSFESYREKRGAVLDSLEIAPTSPPAKPAPPAADVKPRAAETTQTVTKTATPPAPTPDARAPAVPAAAPRSGSSRWVVAGAATVAVVALALVGLKLLAPRPDAPAPAAQESTALPPGEALLQQFMVRNAWDQDAVRNLEVGWGSALTESQRQSTLASPTYASFGDVLRRRLREEEALGGAADSPEFARLADLATALAMPYAASLTRPTPRSAGTPPARAAVEERAQAPIANATPPSVANDSARPEGGSGRPAVAAPSPSSAPAVAPPGAAPPAGNAAATAPAVAAAAAGDGAAPACSAALLSSRRPFCADALRGGGEGPGLVIVAPGQFSMGNDQTPNASPAHAVTVAAPFAMSVYETSFAEFERYCKSTATRCPENPWGDAAFPVVLVSWDEAAAYAEWLSAQTGQRYRLPSEAEWEYAARANTQTPYPFGNEVTPSNARSSAMGPITSPIANTDRSVNRNQFRLMHMIGNVREWVADEWHADYAGAPADGSARVGAEAKAHAVRGGSYADGAPQLRSAARVPLDSVTQDRLTGFRVVRDLGQ